MTKEERSIFFKSIKRSNIEIFFKNNEESSYWRFYGFNGVDTITAIQLSPDSYEEVSPMCTISLDDIEKAFLIKS